MAQFDAPEEDKLGSKFGITSGDEAIRAYAQAMGLSLEAARSQLEAEQAALEPLERNTSLPIKSDIGIVAGEAAVQAYAKLQGITVEAAQADFDRLQEQNRVGEGETVVAPNPFNISGNLDCHAPQWANVFMIAGRGEIVFTFNGRFQLSTGSTTSYVNRAFTCAMDACVLWAYVALVSGDYTTSYSGINAMNSLREIGKNCGIPS